MNPQNCPQCKASVTDTASFCSICGYPLKEQQSLHTVPSGASNGFKKLKKSRNKMITILVSALLILLIANSAVVFFQNRPKGAAVYEQSGNTTNKTAASSVYEQYISTMEQLKEKGDGYVSNGMKLQAQYCYGIAGSSISAFRFAVDNILCLKEEGKTLSEVVGEAYGNWDAIASISYASPYPSYFEGLVYQIQGKEEDAKTCYTNAIMNPSFPKQGVSFYYLNDLSVKELTILKEELVTLERSIYKEYKPDEGTCKRDPMNFNDEYLRALAKEALEQNPADYEAAHQYYTIALKVNPFEPKNFSCLALYAIYMEDMDNAVYYTNEGLWIDEKDEALNKIRLLLQGKKAGESK